jgi:UDP-N-acetylmuramate--alanine ligase
MVNGITIIDDYAHHPDEIAATISTAEKYPHKKLTVIFQPHTYTRTKAFLNDFAKTLSRADRIILADIYAARETDTLGISSEDICRLIKEYGTECIYEPDFDRIPTLIKELCSDGDLVITMGAGNIVEVGETLINNP